MINKVFDNSDIVILIEWINILHQIQNKFAPLYSELRAELEKKLPKIFFLLFVFKNNLINTVLFNIFFETSKKINT